MSENMAHCSAIWSDVKKLEHITQQCEHCLKNHSTSLKNNIALVKDPEIRVGHLIEVSLPKKTLAITLRKKLTKLQFQEVTDKTITTESLSIIQKTQPKPSDKHTFRLPSSTIVLSTKLWILAESAFNFYVNKRIAYLLGTPINIESARETFYHKLIQNTSLPTNYNFTSIITEINKEIEHHTQQRYPITYASKGKEKLQTLAVTPQRIQPPTWKKHRIKSSTNPSYYYTPGSTINIASANVSTLNITSTFGQFPFQNFGITDPWEPTESEKKQEEEKEEESEDQEFTYQNLITENLDIETTNF
ncbi:hypothetical protein G9A89_006393 [Geosiphon pyriformis]|nr:hypothetical protein G9A89_006393 [Geosiphon pyriformis]